MNQAIQIVSATANPDKFKELKAILEAELSKAMEGLKIIPRPDQIPEIEETGETLSENAQIKASGVMAWLLK